MKLFVVLVLSALAVAVQCGHTQEEITAFLSIAMPCKEETGATDADMDVLMKMEPSTTMEAKCLGACIMKKFNVMTADGKFDKSSAMKIAELHTQGDASKLKIAEEVMDICTKIAVSSNHCEAAEEYGHCMKEEAVKLGIEPKEF